MEKIDFSRLPQDGKRFELMVCELLRAMSFQILEQPAVGPDGGRDILIERIMRDALGEKRERVVVQCKHFAHSGRAVNEGDLGQWLNSLVRFNAQGYLLVTSTTVTENLNRVFIAFAEAEPQKSATFWPSEKLELLLNEFVGVRDTFFPPEVPRSSRELGKYGWGVIFPANVECVSIRDSLAPLLDLRRRQIESGKGPGIYREFNGPDGVCVGESYIHWILRHHVGPGSPNPSKIPCFLLLIGGPDLISFEFQANLEVQYFVGRLAFESAADYRAYANAVVAAESGKLRETRNAVLIAAENDYITRASSEQLVAQLAAELIEKRPDWSISSIRGKDASKEAFSKIFGVGHDSSVVFVAAHGVAFAEDSPEQRSMQGALVTSDWGGPEEGRVELSGHVFSASDLTSDFYDKRRIAFLFGCFGAGTTLEDEYSLERDRRLTETPFVAALAQRLLSLGVLAVIGHVGRAWSMSFVWDDAGPQPQTFFAVLESLLSGEPVGVAIQALSKRYAELAAAVESIEQDAIRSEATSVQELHRLKTAMLDAKYYVVLGDPFARVVE